MSSSCLEKYECDGQPLHAMHPVNGIPTRCSACVRINEAVYTLDDLVLQKPFLTTEGMAEAPEALGWEKVQEKKAWEYDDEEGSLGDGMSKEERQAFIDRIVQSFYDSAGQGMTEQEAYGEEAGRDGRQSQASTQVDENADS